MKRFRFKFAAILKLRKAREDEALAALGAAQRAYQEKIARKAALQADLQASLLRRENLGKSPIDILPFQLEEEFITGTKQRIIHADREIMRAGKMVEKALRAYLMCRRQTKMMEVLYDKHHVEFRKLLAKHEQRQLDDLAIMRERMRERLG